MYKKIITVLCLVFMFTGITYSYKAKTGWWIFRRTRSTRPRQATAVCAIRGDLSGVFYNPSLLGTIEQKEIFLLTEIGLAEDTFGGLLYGQPISIIGTAGIAGGFVYYDAGKLTLYWMESGDLKERTVTAQRDILGILSYGQILNESKSIHAGLTLKYANSEIAETKSADAYGFDLGVSYFVPQIEGLTVSLVGQNIGTATKFINRADELPTSVWLGCSYSKELNANSYLAGGFDIPYLVSEERTIPGIGIEYGFKQVSFNIGYRFNVEDSFLHLGFCTTLKNIDFGYAFSPAKYLSQSHRINIGYRF